MDPIRIRPTAIIIRDGKLLLVENDDEGVGVHYNLPGGGLDPHERLLEGVVREVMEETALNIEPVEFLMAWERIATSDEQGTIYMIFRASADENDEPRLPDVPDQFQIGVRWVALDELDQVLLFPGISQHVLHALNGSQGQLVTEPVEDTPEIADIHDLETVIRIRASALIIRNDQVLLVEDDDDQLGFHYDLPGGGLRPGESLHHAARREVLEETGLAIDVGDLALIYEMLPGADEPNWVSHTLDFVFACESPAGAEPHITSTPDSNQTGFRWARFEELENLPLRRGIGRHLEDWHKTGKVEFISTVS